jgi:hypothetical protein
MILTRSQKYASLWTLIWLGGFACIIALSIFRANGHLIYSLDDPYIHLALANNILHGHYGINLEEYSSPSSSILYPLLLAATIFLGCGAFGPLLINSIAAGISVWLLIEFFWRYAVGKASNNKIFGNILSPLLILGISALALPMTGMEHCLHILTVIIAIRGLIELSETGKISVCFVAAIIVMPFVRFEGLALAGILIIIMALLGRWFVAGSITLLIGAGFCLWGLMMHHIELPFLPSSVLTKSPVSLNAQAGHFMGLANSLWDNFNCSIRGRWGRIFIALIYLLSAVVLFNRKLIKPGRPTTEILALSALLVTLVAHLVAGSYDWFYRYEVYAVATLIMCSMYILRSFLISPDTNIRLTSQMMLFLALTVIIGPYVNAVRLTASASKNIYEQQFQMHRFVTDFFVHRVAVNDLGWVSYQNNNYVLDLWGLGSEKVRTLRAADKFDSTAIATITKEAHVDFAMVYGSWFGGSIPRSWCLMAVMQSPHVSAASDNVMFYATTPSVIADMRDALDRFKPTLPPHVTLKRYSNNCS